MKAESAALLDYFEDVHATTQAYLTTLMSPTSTGWSTPTGTRR